MRFDSSVCWSALALWCASGCSESAEVNTSKSARSRAASVPEAELFSSDSVLEVRLEVEDADWLQIRSEGRTLDQVYSRCRAPFEYSKVPARVALDGESLAEIVIRKKGFLGSLSMLKPSLKLELAELDPKQTFRGAKELTLNNSRTDGSFARQCLAYHVFEKAGFAASRCAFAHVFENDRDLGIYVNVEPIKKRMLRRFFANDDGNLYEGNSSADFRTPSLDFFEQKTNESESDKRDLDAVRVALDEPDDEAMLAALEPLVDVERYLRFWAVESLIGHGDGYAGNMNNFYVYHDPASDKLVFIPWGTDGTFSAFSPAMTTGERPPVTLATARLPRRLYAYEATRKRYHQALRDLLDEVWDEGALIAEIDRMQAQLGERAAAEPLEALREFVRNRRASVEKELDDESARWTFAERAAPVCNKAITSPFTAAFATTWGSLEQPADDAELAIETRLDGQPVKLTHAHSAAGMNQSASGRMLAALRLSAPLPDGYELTINFQMPMYPPEAPSEMLLHGLETVGVVQASKDKMLSTLGFIGGGKVVFDRVATQAGEPVTGHIEAEFTQRNPLHR